MKTALDPRHKKRIHIIRELFAWNFQKTKSQPKDIYEITKNLKKIDQIIEQSAPEWPIEKINKIDLAILRLAIFELIIAPRLYRRCVISKNGDIIKKGVPFKVVVDEAVEMAKEFGAESSPGFINGVLGKVIITHKLNRKENEP